MSNYSELSFVRIHSMCLKPTPSHYMSFQSALHLHKIFNDMFVLCTTEHASLHCNVTCTSRQLKFEIIRNNKSKTGMNTITNKFYHISKQVSFDSLNFGFVHFKKLMKIQFLNYGRT